jgi:hypothetical protein
MKTTKNVLSILIAVLTVAIVLYLALGFVAPAFSRSPLFGLGALLSTATPPPGEVIPLKPIEDLTALNATVDLYVNGLINGERAKGDLNILLTMNDQGASKATVTGGLLGDLAAQVGGSLVGLFTPSSVDLYKVPEGSYIVVNSLFPVCVKPKASQSTRELDDMSPQSLLGMLTSSDVARGELVGQETLNGTPVKHYVINGEAFLAAAQKSRDPKLRTFGESLWSAEDIDLYVDAAGGYPVALRGSFSGEYEPLKFEGDFDMAIELTGASTSPAVNLPAACNKPITP